MPFWDRVHGKRPQVTPELRPNFSLNPGKLNQENLTIYLKSLGLFQTPFYLFKSVCLSTLLLFFSQVKLGVLKFLASDLFEPTDVLCHFIVATGDTRHRYVIIQLYIKLALQINSSTLYKSRSTA